MFKTVFGDLSSVMVLSFIAANQLAFNCVLLTCWQVSPCFANGAVSLRS